MKSYSQFFFEIIIHHCKDPVIKQPVWLMESIRLFLLLLLNFLWFSSVFFIDGIFFFGKNSSFCGISWNFFGGKNFPVRSPGTVLFLQSSNSCIHLHGLHLYRYMDPLGSNHRGTGIDRIDPSRPRRSDWLVKSWWKFVVYRGWKDEILASYVGITTSHYMDEIPPN